MSFGIEKKDKKNNERQNQINMNKKLTEKKWEEEKENKLRLYRSKIFK